VAFDFFYGTVPQQGMGSGFVIDGEGHILTNFHVIANAETVEVTLHNKRNYSAKIIGVDRSHDLAVIQISAPDLVPATLGDSRNLAVGQKVFAIGNRAILDNGISVTPGPHILVIKATTNSGQHLQKTFNITSQ